MSKLYKATNKISLKNYLQFTKQTLKYNYVSSYNHTTLLSTLNSKYNLKHSKNHNIISPKSFSSISHPPQSEDKSKDPHLEERTTLVIGVKDHQGILKDLTNSFNQHHINMTRIESRYSQKPDEVIFFVDINLPKHHYKINNLLQELKKKTNFIDLCGSKEVPWFPITMNEVDSLALLVLEGGEDLVEDHPGFNDPVYRERRKQIADAASRYKLGDKPERIAYTKEEIECWKTIWNRLYPLLKQHGCLQYIKIFDEFQKHCGYNENNIPQLADVTDFIKQRTGFKLRPTAGLISSRHFLNGLAFKIFFCTQYLRHFSVPFYTPEPDVVHELVGHAPMFADPEFASFSQEIGLASIGASDEQINQLARCYWFSVEFGLCRKHPGSNERKIYGAGILSSFGEIEYSMSDKPQIRDWNPFQAAHQEYPITKYQPIYYLADSFEDAKFKMQEFASSLDKPFTCRWDNVNEKLIVDRNIRRGPKTLDKGSYVGTKD